MLAFTHHPLGDDDDGHFIKCALFHVDWVNAQTAATVTVTGPGSSL